MPSGDLYTSIHNYMYIYISNYSIYIHICKLNHGVSGESSGSTGVL